MPASFCSGAEHCVCTGPGHPFVRRYAFWALEIRPPPFPSFGPTLVGLLQLWPSMLPSFGELKQVAGLCIGSWENLDTPRQEEVEVGLIARDPIRCTQLGAKPLVDGLPLEDHQVAAALMGNVGGLPHTGPISALRLVLALSAALSLPVGESELCGQLTSGKLCKTDNRNC